MLQQQIKAISSEPCNDNCPNECQCLFVNIRSFLEFSRLHCNFCFCNWLKQLNSLHSITNCDAVDQILFKFRINKLTSHKFITLSLEKSKGLLLSLKYSKRVSTAILAALFADGGNLWCRLYSLSTMRI